MNDILEIAAANQQRASEVIRDTDLEAIWRSVGAEANLVGSLRTGLLMKHRDIDFHIYSSPLRVADSFAAMEASGPAQAFLSAPTPLHPLCGDCRAFPLCGGGCRRTREFFAAEDGYCPYQDFLYACADDLAALARRL